MVRHKVEDSPRELEETVAEVKCSHYWIIEPPQGLTSMGVCKLCGEEREFKNRLRPNELIAPILLSLNKIVMKEEEDGNEDEETP